MKILISDFDGTFFTEEYEKNIKLVNDFVDKGNMFVIATGRNITGLMKDINDKYIKCSYFICNNGATIFDQFLNVMFRKDIDIKYNSIITKLLNDDSNISSVLIDTSTSFVNDVNRSANKIAGRFINKEKAYLLCDKINDKYNQLYAYLSTQHININSREITKASAIRFLEKHYNFDKHDIYTVGNDCNDLSLSEYENSFIMKDSDIALKKEFGYVVDNFEEVIKKIG